MASLATATRPAPPPAAQPASRTKAARASLAPVAQVFVCDFGAKVLWGATGLALVRFLPAGEFATLTVALAVSGLMVEGVGENLNRIYIVGYERLHLAGKALPLLLLQCCALTGMIVPLCVFWNGSGLLAGLIAVLAIAGTLLAFSRTMLQRELRFWAYSLLEVARTLLFASALAVLLIVWRGGVTAWQVLLLQAVCAALVAAAALAVTLDRRRWGQAWGAWTIARQVVAEGYAVMVGYVLAVAMMGRVNVLMLKWLDSSFELATYGTAFRYYAMLTLLLSAVHSVLLPLTQRATRKDELSTIFRRYRLAILAVGPAVLLGAWASTWFVPLVDGGRYPGAAAVFQVLCVSTVASLACSPYVNLLFRYGDFSFLLALACASLALNVGLTAALLPELHAAGAATALCLATGAMNVVIYVRARMLLAGRPLPAHTPEAGAL